MANTEKDMVSQSPSTPMIRADLEAAFAQIEPAFPPTARFLIHITGAYMNLAGIPVGLLLPQSCALGTDCICGEITQEERTSWINAYGTANIAVAVSGVILCECQGAASTTSTAALPCLSTHKL